MPKPLIAAGVLFVAPDGDILLLRRSSKEENYAGHWALPGGGVEEGETPEGGAERECLEEIGVCPRGERRQIDERLTPNGWTFYTFEHRVDEKFVPKLNDEHSGYAWAPRDMLPEPMHPAVKATLRKVAMDGKLAFDRAIMAGQPKRKGLAFDRASATVRTIDKDGRMRVEVSNISKATVNPYLGDEIPDGERLGLDPKKIYYLLRDPKELEKAADTFNGVPLLDIHVATTADDHRPEHIVGAAGTDAVFEHPYLKNSLIVWADKGIKAVQSNKKKELSCAYHYRADMTPGVFEGKKYDGVMRDIVGNHVALVEEGRAGTDVVVGDSVNPAITEMFAMSKKNLLSRKATVAHGALMVFLKPKLALDAKLDLNGALKGVTAKNFASKKSALSGAIAKAVEGKLAQDATLEGLEDLLNMVEQTEVAGADEFPEKQPPGAKDEEVDEDADNEGAEDEDKEETEAEKKAREKKEAADKKAADKKAADEAAEKDKEEKKAMDAKIKLATDEAIAAERKNQQEIAAAKEKVRPIVGSLSMAFDSAGDVYRHVLKAQGKDASKITDVAALEMLVDTLPPAGGSTERSTIAMDSAGAADFAKRHPNAARIGTA